MITGQRAQQSSTGPATGQIWRTVAAVAAPCAFLGALAGVLGTRAAFPGAEREPGAGRFALVAGTYRPFLPTAGNSDEHGNVPAIFRIDTRTGRVWLYSANLDGTPGALIEVNITPTQGKD